MAEVINLSDDDEVVCEDDSNASANNAVQKPFRCLNSECRSPDNLRRAPDSVRRYYGVLAYPKKTRVCLTCFARVNLYQRLLTQQLRDGMNIMSISTAPQRDTVLLTDSDSDPEPDAGERSTESEIELSLSESDSIEGDSEGPSNLGEHLRAKLTKMIDLLKLEEQVSSSIVSVTQRMEKAQSEFKLLDQDFATIDKEMNSIRVEFYDTFKPLIRMLPELDVDNPSQDDQLEVFQATQVRCEAPLPPIGLLCRPRLSPGQQIYAMKYSLFARWVPATVLSITDTQPNNTTYLVRYARNQSNIPPRKLTGRQLSYFDPCPTRLMVGTRVIARYKDDAPNKTDAVVGSFFVGIVAEVPTVANKYKYLIFFDDGYAQYVVHTDIRVVTEASSLPWEDVCSDSRDFIKEYVQMYPERPMVRLQKWNTVKTEWNGKWWRAQVMEVEGSLVKMYFPMDGRTEWIYRGSTRLSPLFHKKMSLQANNEQTSRLTARRRTIVPIRNSGSHVVEYGTYGQEKAHSNAAESDVPPLDAAPESVRLPTAPPVRSVARKSTAAPRPPSPPGPPSQELLEKIQQEKTGYIRKAQIPPLSRRFRPHQCGPVCVGGAKGEELLKRNRNISPLLIPIVLGWRRQIVKQRKKTQTRKSIYYVTPCCRRVRTVDELFTYLRLVHSKLEIDFFSFELSIDVINEWAPHKELYSMPDFSRGIEPMPISVVNSLECEAPLPLEYCNVRTPLPDVPLNLDPGFLVCCTCTDDCQNKEKCACWQLTLESNNRLPEGARLKDPGYSQRRLYEQVPTGIFECNSQCSCRHTCLNRVVQNPLRLKLQLFKTARRGWGVRALHDVPRGSFLCVYVGKVISDEVANQEGQISGGDDYYADLDFIEVVESMKDGYEDEAEEFTDEEDNKKKSLDDSSENEGSDAELPSQKFDKSDDVYKLNLKSNPSERLPSSRIQARANNKRKLDSASDLEDGSASSKQRSSSPHNEDDDHEDEKQRQRQNFSASASLAQQTLEKKQSLREYYGEKEEVYIMDAKKSGNIGRFLNHSCQPNVFVQNVFVDSQDLRFPYMSFFAVTSIRAGQELTWDYAYEVGTVAGKVKYCYCGAKKCRGRLL